MSVTVFRTSPNRRTYTTLTVHYSLMGSYRFSSRFLFDRKRKCAPPTGNAISDYGLGRIKCVPSYTAQGRIIEKEQRDYLTLGGGAKVLKKRGEILDHGSCEELGSIRIGRTETFKPVFGVIDCINFDGVSTERNEIRLDADYKIRYVGYYGESVDQIISSQRSPAQRSVKENLHLLMVMASLLDKQCVLVEHKTRCTIIFFITRPNPGGPLALNSIFRDRLFRFHLFCGTY